LSKTSEKWEWVIGQPPPPLDPHSKVKHQVVADYLRQYVSVLMANEKIPSLKLTLVDGFSGGGLYTDGPATAYGSPLLMLKTIQEAEALLNVNRSVVQRKVDAQYHFVEVEKNTCEYLKHILTGEGYSERIGRDIALYHNDFEDVGKNIVASAANRKGGQRALFLLDQYSYDKIKLQTVQHILSNLQGAEIILTFNFDSLLSFLTDSDKFHKITRKIGLEQYINWHGYAALKSQGRWREMIQRQLAYGIWKASGARFMTLFFVTPLGDTPWSYWLVHLSNSYKANDVMKGVHWQYGNSFGHSLEPGLFQIGYQANQDESVTGQGGFEFSTPAAFDGKLLAASVEALQERLPRIIYNQSEGTSFGSIMEGIANQTNATADIVRNALHQSILTKDIQAVSSTGIFRTKGSSIHQSDIIMPNKQKSIFVVA
jgi:three-Cys-motif partner protein